MKNYKVCILTAGVGSRMGEGYSHVNKAVLPVNFKAVISYMVEKFPTDVEIVVAVGHKKETVMDYLTISYPERKFTFVEIEKYMGPGTGPGYSLLQCKKHLQCPFIFIAADTIVIEDIPPPKENWFGIAPVKETEPYCTVKIKNNLVYQLDDKIKTDNKFAFIGLAGVHNHEEFFSSLEKNKEPISGEIQVSNGFKKLIEKKLSPIGFTWFDTGTLDNYRETNKNFSGSEEKFDFSKVDGFIYFVNGQVIKYFSKPEQSSNRVKRASLLKGLVPKVTKQKGNFFAYKKIEGSVLYSVLNTQIVRDFLYWAHSHLWKKVTLSKEEQKEFDQACVEFYQEKTKKRITQFYDKTNIIDHSQNVNGTTIPPLQEMLDHIDWKWLCKGTPVTFHGDLQFDNVLVSRDEKTQLQKFILLDWRDDFGGFLKAGDLYYDLAKMYGGLTISYQLIKQGMFSFDMSGSSVYYNYFVKSDLLEAKEEFEQFLRKNKYDVDKIKVLTAIIFLNMSPLHNDPFDLMIYFMGKSLLHKSLSTIKRKP